MAEGPLRAAAFTVVFAAAGWELAALEVCDAAEDADEEAGCCAQPAVMAAISKALTNTDKPFLNFLIFLPLNKEFGTKS